MKTKHSKLADRYGEIKALQAKLASEEKALKQRLLKLEAPVIEGDLFRITISHIAPTERFDAAMAKTLLSAAAIAKCMKRNAGAIRFLAKARVAEATI